MHPLVARSLTLVPHITKRICFEIYWDDSNTFSPITHIEIMFIGLKRDFGKCCFFTMHVSTCWKWFRNWCNFFFAMCRTHKFRRRLMAHNKLQMQRGFFLDVNKAVDIVIFRMIKPEGDNHVWKSMDHTLWHRKKNSALPLNIGKKTSVCCWTHKIVYCQPTEWKFLHWMSK